MILYCSVNISGQEYLTLRKNQVFLEALLAELRSGRSFSAELHARVHSERAPDYRDLENMVRAKVGQLPDWVNGCAWAPELDDMGHLSQKQCGRPRTDQDVLLPGWLSPRIGWCAPQHLPAALELLADRRGPACQVLPVLLKMEAALLDAKEAVSNR